MTSSPLNFDGRRGHLRCGVFCVPHFLLLTRVWLSHYVDQDDGGHCGGCGRRSGRAGLFLSLSDEDWSLETAELELWGDSGRQEGLGFILAHPYMRVWRRVEDLSSTGGWLFGLLGSLGLCDGRRGGYRHALVVHHPTLHQGHGQ